MHLSEVVPDGQVETWWVLFPKVSVKVQGFFVSDLIVEGSGVERLVGTAMHSPNKNDRVQP